eukprot:CAMPEP_0171851078 /NCGR_PEP_ID=MMETSP0992-20121227/20770_1 /TAXON_ID=483369 /ORGANISM="non described non described, Strain CCMP2098" /LENGTH=46 /DNA_ID= /DNA_START= /DNA_END= /DNA_ORIENTATION=
MPSKPSRAAPFGASSHPPSKPTSSLGAAPSVVLQDDAQEEAAVLPP